MQNNHDEFLNDVINRVSLESAKAKTLKSRKKIEQSTIEALQQSTDLNQDQIKAIMEDIRQKQKLEESNKRTLNQKKITISKLMLIFIVCIFICSFSIFMLNGFFNSNSNHAFQQSQQVVNAQTSKNNPESSALVDSIAYQNYLLLVNAIQENKINLVIHLIEQKKVPLYLSISDNSDNFDVFYESTLINNRMIKTLLKYGADPFYNFTNYQLAVENAYNNNNQAFFAIVFNHLAKLSSTDEAIKKLWENKIPYTQKSLNIALEKKDIQTLELFNQANHSKYHHNWFDLSLKKAIQENDIDSVSILYDILINKETNNTKKENYINLINSIHIETSNQDMFKIFNPKNNIDNK